MSDWRTDFPRNIAYNRNVNDFTSVSSTELSGDVTGNSGSNSLTATGVVAGTYGDASNIPQITVDSKGRLTDVTNVALPGGGVASSRLAAFARLSSNFSFNTNVFTTIVWNTTDLPDLATQPNFNYLNGTFTCTEAGFYKVEATVFCDAATGRLSMLAYKNGEEMAMFQDYRTYTGVQRITMSVSGVAYFNVNDFLSIQLNNIEDAGPAVGRIVFPLNSTQVSVLKID